MLSGLDSLSKKSSTFWASRRAIRQHFHLLILEQDRISQITVVHIHVGDLANLSCRLAPARVPNCPYGHTNKAADAAYVSLSLRMTNRFILSSRRTPFGLAPDGAANSGGFPALAGTQSRALGGISEGMVEAYHGQKAPSRQAWQGQVAVAADAARPRRPGHRRWPVRP